MKRNSYFTLIELLIVIAVLSILLTLLLPSLERAREISKRAVCASNLSQLTKVAFLFSQSNDGKLPERTGRASLTPSGHHDDKFRVKNDWGKVFDIIDGHDFDADEPSPLFFCPSQRYSPKEVWMGIGNHWKHTDYSYWGWSNLRMGAFGSSWVGGYEAPTYLPKVEDSNVPLFGDFLMTGSYKAYNHVKSGQSGHHYVTNSSSSHPTGTFSGINQAQVDGAVEWRMPNTFKTVYRTSWDGEVHMQWSEK